MRRLGRMIVATGLGFGLLCGAAGGVANADPGTDLTNLLSNDTGKSEEAPTSNGPEQNADQIVGGGAGIGGAISSLGSAIS